MIASVFNLWLRYLTDEVKDKIKSINPNMFYWNFKLIFRLFSKSILWPHHITFQQTKTIAFNNTESLKYPIKLTIISPRTIQLTNNNRRPISEGQLCVHPVPTTSIIIPRDPTQIRRKRVRVVILKQRSAGRYSPLKNKSMAVWYAPPLTRPYNAHFKL